MSLTEGEGSRRRSASMPEGLRRSWTILEPLLNWTVLHTLMNGTEWSMKFVDKVSSVSWTASVVENPRQRKRPSLYVFFM